jgi:hypothetical protein
MMDFRPITLEKRDQFNEYITKNNCHNSEASFANMYIWQPSWDIRMHTDPGALFLSMGSDQYRYFLVPPHLKDPGENIGKYMRMCEEYMRDTYGDFFLKGATRRVMDKINADCPGRYEFLNDPHNSEYIYNTSDLMELKGKKYHSKRNHIHAFLKNYAPAFEEYTPRYREECVAIQRAWAAEKEENERDAAEEMESITRALDLYEYLGLKGCVVRIDGEVAAFSFGEQVCDHIAIIHIEKAKSGFGGLYAYINREFVTNFWSHCKYINREEDMGVPGIRKAKQSYRPVWMLDKYDVTLAKG